MAIWDSNRDGVINADDYPWWGKLRVWIDPNHNGVAEPNELHTLDSLGITGISLNYESSPKTDQYGNQFRLKGTLMDAPDDHVDLVIYDVWLISQK